MEGGYEHPLFRKDDRELCKKIKIRPRPRQRTASSGGSGGSSVSGTFELMMIKNKTLLPCLKDKNHICFGKSALKER